MKMSLTTHPAAGLEVRRKSSQRRFQPHHHASPTGLPPVPGNPTKFHRIPGNSASSTAQPIDPQLPDLKTAPETASRNFFLVNISLASCSRFRLRISPNLLENIFSNPLISRFSRQIFRTPKPSTQTFDTNLRHKPSTQTFDTNLRHKPSTQTFDPNLRPKPSTQTFDPNLRPKPSTQTLNPNLKPKPSTQTLNF
jgi:hypothetical protein